MRYTSSFRRVARIEFGVLLFLICGAEAFGADSYNLSNKQLSIPSLAIGSATFSKVVVVISGVVSGPSGTSPNSGEDSYDPANNQLTVPEVTVGASTYYNVIATVSSLASIGGVTGVDTYSGTTLTIPYVLVLGGSLYTNVVIT